MGKIISSGLAKPDDPMFTGGVETFVVRKPVPASETSQPDPANGERGTSLSNLPKSPDST